MFHAAFLISYLKSIESLDKTLPILNISVFRPHEPQQCTIEHLQRQFEVQCKCYTF